MELFRKNKSKYYWYDFTVRGERYRGSTKETNETRAQKAAALKLAAAIKGSDPLDRKPPTLREYSKDFLQWVETGRLEADSRRYYRNGWRLLEQTKIAGMRMDQITKDEVEKLQFPGSASNGNNALRTLRRMYSKAKEDKLIFEVPDFALFKEHGRSLRLNDEAERRLSAVADQPLKDIIVVMRDTGMRNARELYCMRVENVDFDTGTIFTRGTSPHGTPLYLRDLVDIERGYAGVTPSVLSRGCNDHKSRRISRIRPAPDGIGLASLQHHVIAEDRADERKRLNGCGRCGLAGRRLRKCSNARGKQKSCSNCDVP